MSKAALGLSKAQAPLAPFYFLRSFLSPAFDRFWLAVGLALLLSPSFFGFLDSAMAQTGGPIPGLSSRAAPNRFSGPEKSQALALAREVVQAAAEDRGPRVPQNLSARLNAAQPLAVSLYLDGKLIARTWEVERPQALASQIMPLTARALTDPKLGRVPLKEEMARLKIGLAVFSKLEILESDLTLPPGHGVIVLNGFKEGLAIPSDLGSGGQAADLLSFAATSAGLRPKAWLLPESSLFSALVDEMAEK